MSIYESQEEVDRCLELVLELKKSLDKASSELLLSQARHKTNLVCAARSPIDSDERRLARKLCDYYADDDDGSLPNEDCQQ